MTVVELNQVIHEVIEEFLEPKGAFRPEAKKILQERLSSQKWIGHNEI